MPQNMPSAEITVGSDLVRLLLLEQFPDLASQPLTVLTNGWDNALLRLGDDLLVRLPRRQAAARLVEHEQRWLPQLASTLPLPIPVPVYFGQPGPAFPWSWSIVNYLSGVTAAHAHSRLDYHTVANTLGSFLADLHHPAPAEAPVNPFRGVSLHQRAETFHTNLAIAGTELDAIQVGRVWRRSVDADPWQHAPTWVHGDLHPANLLVDQTRDRPSRLAAVLDFGDLTSGDPACDLSIAWMLLPHQHREAFWASYNLHAQHSVDAALHTRARGWALMLGMVFLAHSADNPTMKQIGSRTVAATLDHSN